MTGHKKNKANTLFTEPTKKLIFERINQMEFSLRIKMGNEAMQTHIDLSKSLAKVANLVYQGKMAGTILDLQGYAVGNFETKTI